jgi:hypothetical protein
LASANKNPTKNKNAEVSSRGPLSLSGGENWRLPHARDG